LTGTPALAKPKEIFNLMHIIRPDVFRNFREFGKRYCDPQPSKWQRGIDYEGSSNVKELHFILRKNFMIRRLKKDVLTELPDKKRTKVLVQADKKIVSEI